MTLQAEFLVNRFSRMVPQINRQARVSEHKQGNSEEEKGWGERFHVYIV